MPDIILFKPIMNTPRRRGIVPPWSLLYISSFLTQSGYKIKIVDQNIAFNWRREILKELKKKEPICFGITSPIGKQLDNVFEFSKFIKEHSRSPLIFGGIHPTMFPVESLKSPFIDIVVQGEGEKTFFELVKAIEKNKNLKNIKGILYKKRNKIINTGERPLLDLNEIPNLPYDLVDMKEYICKRGVFPFGIGEGGRSLDFFTSRGCPHNCTFCYNQKYNRNIWRTWKIDKIIEHINLVKHKFEIDNLYFVDDNFFVSKKRVKAICNALKKEGIDVNWCSKCRIDYFNNYDEGFINLMMDTGLKALQFGVESGSQRMLNLMKKGIKLSQVTTVNKKLIKHKLSSKWGFMTGVPYEKKEDRITTLKLIYKISRMNKYVKRFLLPLYNPYPGTRMYGDCLKLGFKPPTTLEGWIRFNKYTFTLPWLSEEESSMIKDCQFIAMQLTSNNLIIRKLAQKRLKEFITKNKAFMPEKYVRKIFDNMNPLRFGANFRGILKI